MSEDKSFEDAVRDEINKMSSQIFNYGVSLLPEWVPKDVALIFSHAALNVYINVVRSNFEGLPDSRNHEDLLNIERANLARALEELGKMSAQILSKAQEEKDDE